MFATSACFCAARSCGVLQAVAASASKASNTGDSGRCERKDMDSLHDNGAVRLGSG
jgi:hypothetical protein